MKKTYIAPSVEVFKVNAANIIASSIGISETSVDTYDVNFNQLGREDNSLSGKNIWDEGW